MRTTLKENEKIEVTVKKHWFVLVRPALLTVLFVIITAIIKDSLIVGVFRIFGLLSFISIIVLLYRVIDRNSNVWVVTNYRVIDEHGVFSRNSKETPLDKINNVSYRQPLFGRIFNYGHLEIQSAAESGATVHRWIQNPKLLQNTIAQSQEQYKYDQISDQANSLATAFTSNSSPPSNIADEIQKLHSLREKGILSEEEYQKGKNKLLS